MSWTDKPKKEMTRMSWLVKTLIKFRLIPVTVDWKTKQAKFSLCSRNTMCFFSISLAPLVILTILAFSTHVFKLWLEVEESLVKKNIVETIVLMVSPLASLACYPSALLVARGIT